MLPLAFRRLAVRHDQKKEVRARAPALLLQGLCVVALASAYTTDGAITARIVAASKSASTGGTAATASRVAAKEFVSMGVIVPFVSSAAAKASVSIGNAMLCARSAVLHQLLHPRSLLLLLLLLLRLQLRLKRLRVHLRP